MPTRGLVSVKRGSTQKNDDLLRTKYLCQITDKQLLEVVMEISAPPRTDKRPPLRYVLVIDVSSSMKYKVGKSSESLLARVKVFAELVIRKISNKDSLGIVSFAKDVKIEFPMTQMTDDSKSHALGIVRSLTVRGGTNLELGMMTGLKVLKESPSTDDKDLIIIFTDGEANKGKTNATELIENYREAQSSLGKSSCVPLSSFTIGGYVPVLLDELSRNLGSDAFYWLNENEEFESDMLIPIFLREETHVTDVSIEMNCLEDVTFDVDSTYQMPQMELSSSKLSYFIHSCPQDMKKHIPLKFLLPAQIGDEEKKIVDIEITYLDDNMKRREKKDYVFFSSVSLSDITNVDGRSLLQSDSTLLNQISAYAIKDNIVHSSKKAAQTSLMSIADSKYRVESMVALEKLVKSISNDEEDAARADVVKSAVSDINKVKEKYSSLLRKLNSKKSIGQLNNSASDWIEKLEFGGTLDSKGSLGRLFAMKSSLKNEMPSAKGVFSPDQKRPFISDKVEKKLHHYEKIVAATKEKRKKERSKSSGPVKMFKTQNILVSESLRDKKIGAKRETMSEIIVKCGGRPVPNVNTVRTDTFLVCSDKDYQRKSMIVRDAKQAKDSSSDSESKKLGRTISEPLHKVHDRLSPYLERQRMGQTKSEPLRGTFGGKSSPNSVTQDMGQIDSNQNQGVNQTTSDLLSKVYDETSSISESRNVNQTTSDPLSGVYGKKSSDTESRKVNITTSEPLHKFHSNQSPIFERHELDPTDLSQQSNETINEVISEVTENKNGLDLGIRKLGESDFSEESNETISRFSGDENAGQKSPNMESGKEDQADFKRSRKVDNATGKPERKSYGTKNSAVKNQKMDRTPDSPRRKFDSKRSPSSENRKVDRTVGKTGRKVDGRGSPLSENRKREDRVDNKPKRSPAVENHNATEKSTRRVDGKRRPAFENRKGPATGRTQRKIDDNGSVNSDESGEVEHRAGNPAVKSNIKKSPATFGNRTARDKSIRKVDGKRRPAFENRKGDPVMHKSTRQVDDDRSVNSDESAEANHTTDKPSGKYDSKKRSNFDGSRKMNRGSSKPMEEADGNKSVNSDESGEAEHRAGNSAEKSSIKKSPATLGNRTARDKSIRKVDGKRRPAFENRKEDPVMHKSTRQVDDDRSVNSDESAEANHTTDKPSGKDDSETSVNSDESGEMEQSAGNSAEKSSVKKRPAIENRKVDSATGKSTRKVDDDRSVNSDENAEVNHTTEKPAAKDDSKKRSNFNEGRKMDHVSSKPVKKADGNRSTNFESKSVRQAETKEKRKVSQRTGDPDDPSSENDSKKSRKSELSGTRNRRYNQQRTMQSSLDSRAESPAVIEELLQAKYYCQVTKRKDIDLVMEIYATPRTDDQHSQVRYVLVIDVSGSMDSNVGRTSDSMLDRIKVFVEVLIQKISTDDSLAIVSFSDDANIDLPMTRMTRIGKEKALESVLKLTSRGETNLEIALMTALDVLRGDSDENARDLIILFTDGDANEGETDSEVLIKKYREAQNSLGKSSDVPLSAFTIGTYAPILLNSLAKQLGSDAFYWLNGNEEFERDLLLPLVMRNQTSVTDINILMTCRDGIIFDVRRIYETQLMEISPEQMKKFIFSMPSGTRKQIHLKLTVTKDIEHLIGEDIVDVTITYLDNLSRQKTLNDSVMLVGPIPGEDDATQTTEDSLMIIIPAYSVTNNVPDTSEEGVQNALAAIADSKCRVWTMAAISKITNSLLGLKHVIPGKVARETILKINKINSEYKSQLEESSAQALLLRENVGNWIARVNFSGTLKEKRSLGRLFSVKSSIENEAPSARGVFDSQQRQPYLFRDLESKLHQYEKTIKKVTRIRREEKHGKFFSEFRAQNVMLSESLRHKKVGRKNETLWELIVKCGGRPVPDISIAVPNVHTMNYNTLLVCDGKDLKQDTVLVKDAKRAKIPIVREQYIHDCVTQKMMINKLKPYLH